MGPEAPLITASFSSTGLPLQRGNKKFFSVGETTCWKASSHTPASDWSSLLTTMDAVLWGLYFIIINTWLHDFFKGL